MRYFIAFLFLFAAFSAPFIAHAEKAISVKEFHIPQTEAELTLKNILIRGQLKAVPFFTPALSDAIARAEAIERKKLCRSDTPHEVPCTLDSPLTCGAQDVDHPYFLTLRNDYEGQAVIMAILTGRPNEKKTAKGPVYIMVKGSDGWKLDGIECKKYRLNVE